MEIIFVEKTFSMAQFIKQTTEINALSIWRCTKGTYL